MMDAETYLFGQEIVDNGFADTLIQSEEKKEKVAAIAQARINIQGLRAKFSNTEQAKNDLQQVAAMFGNQLNNLKITTSVAEFKGLHPSVYDQFVQDGINKIRQRIKDLHALKRQPAFSRLPGIDGLIDKAILDGSTVEEVQTSLFAMLLTPSNSEIYDNIIREV